MSDETTLGLLPALAAEPKSNCSRNHNKKGIQQNSVLFQCKNYGCVFFRSDQLILGNQHGALEGETVFREWLFCRPWKSSSACGARSPAVRGQGSSDPSSLPCQLQVPLSVLRLLLRAEVSCLARGRHLWLPGQPMKERGCLWVGIKQQDSPALEGPDDGYGRWIKLTEDF